MTPAAPSSIEDSAWTSVLVILTIATVLGVNAVLLHATNRKANGRLVRPLLRIATGRSRARSLSMTEVQQQPSLLPLPPPPPPPPPPPEIVNNRGSEVWDTAARWVRWDPNAWTRATVQGWIDNGDEDSAWRWERRTMNAWVFLWVPEP